MRLSRRTGTLSALFMAAAFALTGCASGGGTAEAGGDAAADGLTTIRIQNNHTAGRDMIYRLEPDGRGERIQLGSIAAGQTQTFSQPVPAGAYWIVAGSDAGDVRSDRMNLQGPSEISWVMGANRLTVRRR
ncbi:MAG: hypothetical protein EA350_03325 [Gemmatimonadales bacterium]|nr:MAG: hypothetical protein EA350_03325 [Gemmatimonadales bacterium]